MFISRTLQKSQESYLYLANRRDLSDSMVTIDKNAQTLRIALTSQAGETRPRVEVERDSKKLSYADLERMGTRDLAWCNISILGSSLTFNDHNSEKLSATWASRAGVIIGNGDYGFRTDQPAVKTLEEVYGIIISCMSGDDI